MANRDWVEKDFYRELGVGQGRLAGRDQEGLPQDRAGEPPRHQARRREGRGAVQGGGRGVRRPLRHRRSASEYDEARALFAGRPLRRLRRWRGRRLRRPRRRTGAQGGFDVNDLFGGGRPGGGGGGGIGDLLGGIFGGMGGAGGPGQTDPTGGMGGAGGMGGGLGGTRASAAAPTSRPRSASTSRRP